MFAGGGGLAMAVNRAGFRPLLVNEFVKHACDTLEANGAKLRGEEEKVPGPGDPWPLVRGDVRDLKMGYLHDQVDLLAGGPPCQPFSLGGVAKGDEDLRNMFPEMFRAIREIQPRAVICENVRGLLRPSFRPYFDYIVRELSFPFEERDPEARWFEHDALLRETERRGVTDPREHYRVYQFEVNAADYGVPQIRNRVFLLAFRGDLDINEKILRAAVAPTHSEAALLHSLRTGAYWEVHHKVSAHVRRKVMANVPDMLPLSGDEPEHKPWRTLRDALEGLVDNSGALPQIRWNRLDRTQYDNMPADHVGWPDARIYPGHTPNVMDRPAKTVKAGVHGVPGGESVLLTDSMFGGRRPPGSERYRHRYMTVRETARVMTFPDDWKLCGPRGEKMRQLGNAVPVLLGEVFAQAVARVLDDVDSRS